MRLGNRWQTTIRPVLRLRATVHNQPETTSTVCSSKTVPTPQSASGVPATHLALTLLTTLTAASPACATVLDAPAVHSISIVLRLIFTLFTFLYIVRIPMTWYPDIKVTEFPWTLAYGPTEPVLEATRKIVPLVGGVDVTPIVWVALLSFFNEILLGPQGLLILIERQGGI